ncbi:MAG: flagellar basal body rod protein FlgB [Nitrospirae bacterium]|nr:MAG: flagellar basal body rod protein FlgB [Nitrospirota bacterium]
MDLARLLLPAIPTYERALTVRGLRQELIGRNLANAATPGYRAVELPFEAAMERLSAQEAPPPLAATDRRHLQPEAAAAPDLPLVETGEPGPDGNSVDLEAEAGRMAANSLLYDATAQITAAYMNHLLRAIREGR